MYVQVTILQVHSSFFNISVPLLCISVPLSAFTYQAFFKVGKGTVNVAKNISVPLLNSLKASFHAVQCKMAHDFA